jgi:hypothetical protein
MSGHNFSTSLQAILELAPSYSKSSSENPPMEKRESLLKGLSDELTVFLQEVNLDSHILKVEHGGRISNYSPLAWVRIYDPQHAPNATSGFYVVLLFSADGSSVYLSLNQGTSEFRSNAMRPINDENVLLNRAAAARTALDDWATQVALLGPEQMDLKGDTAPVGSESKRRIRNYELGNVFAYEYPITSLPSDNKLQEDLEELLVLLWALESADLTSPTEFVKKMPQVGSPDGKKSPSSKQGRQLNQKVRKLIELTAEDLAEEHYVALGWTVKRVGAQKLGYDLRSMKDEEELHVEVKGTTGKGLEVILTPNEVKHCKEYDAMSLVVVSHIVIADDETVTDRGKIMILDPWTINDTYLTPSEYSYRVK